MTTPLRLRGLRLVAGLALLPLAVSGPAHAAPQELEGRWLLDFERGEDRVQLTMKRESARHRSENSWGVRRDELRGLVRPEGSTEVPARFELVRDAGTVVFEGRLDGRGGSGRFRFTPSQAFEAAWESSGRPALTSEQAYGMAIHDVSRQFISDLAALGYRDAGVDDLLALRIHGATAAWIRELHALGYEKVSLDDLVAFRIHGVGPDAIRELQALGYAHLPADDLVAFRIHGVSPEFVRSLGSLGYERVPADDLVAFRIHGVSSEYVRAFRELGYRHIAGEDFVAMRIHAVSPEFVRDLQGLGYRDVPVDDLVAMRIHGVTVDFVRRNRAADSNVSIEEIVSRKIHGRS